MMAAQVTLREPRDADMPILSLHQRDANAARMAAVPSRDEVAFAAHWAKTRADPSVTRRVIEADGQVVGNIVSFERDGQREVGYQLGREHWGKGIATQALSAFLAVETTRPLHAVVATRNAGSMRVLQKCGFTITGGERVFDDLLGEDVEITHLELS